MGDYPETIFDFENQFATEESCRDYLYRLRWPEGICCSRCNCKEIRITTRNLYRCRNCHYEFSVTSGTIFQDTRISLLLWFRAIWQVVTQKHGISALGLQKILGFKRYETTWALLHKLRIAMVRPGRDCLSGTVQVDEIYIGVKRHGKRGRGASGKALVIVCVEDKEKRAGRIRLKKIRDASASSLIPSIKESIKPNSEVCTDCWNGYIGLTSAGYHHRLIRQTADVGENLLPLVNRVAALLKRWLQGTHQGSPRASHLDYYLDEFVFRFNRRTSRSRGMLFYRLIQQAVTVSPVKKKDIINRNCKY